MSLELFFEILEQAVKAGSLQHLSLAFARFMADLGLQDQRQLLAAAMLCEAEAAGHSCLTLQQLQARAAPLPDLLAALENAGCRYDWPEQAGQWEALLAASAQIDTGGERPQALLVLRSQALYLRRYWQYESDIAGAVLQRVSDCQPVNETSLRACLPLLFGSAVGQPDWQQIACLLALRARLTVITGGPGTGKTYTAARLLALYFATASQPEALRVALAAPTGKAAARLKQAIDQALNELRPVAGLPVDVAALFGRTGAARTLHSLLGARPDTRTMRHHAGNPLDLDLLIVDEASMIHLEMMRALLDALRPGTTLILLGDKDQLASVEAGAVLGDLCAVAEAAPYSPATVDYLARCSAQQLPPQYLGGSSAVAQQIVMLRESRRFGGAIGQLALAVNQGDCERAMSLLAASAELDWMKNAALNQVLELVLPSAGSAESSGYLPYLQLLKAGPAAQQHFDEWVCQLIRAFEQFRLLCAVRTGDWGVAGLNQLIEQQLRRSGRIAAHGEWYPGRPVMVTRNDYASAVFNGDIGMTLADPDNPQLLRVYFLEGEQLRSVPVTRLRYAETAFAMTVHKSQGSEFAHTVMVLPTEYNPVLTRELVYTGITRARTRFTLISPNDQVIRPAIERRTERHSGLAQLFAAGVLSDTSGSAPA